MAACGGRQQGPRLPQTGRAASPTSSRIGTDVLGVPRPLGPLFGRSPAIVRPDRRADAEPEAPTVQLPGLTATLEQYREDEIQGFVGVRRRTARPPPSQFHDLRLQWPGIDEQRALRALDAARTGRQFDIRVLRAMPSAATHLSPNGALPADAALAVGTASIDGATPVVVAMPIEDSGRSCPRCSGARAWTSG